MGGVTRRYVTGFRSLLRIQGVLLGLITLMFLIYFAQEIFGRWWYEPLMPVPAEIGESWRHLREGAATFADGWEFATLLTCAFLHGSMEHVTSNMIFFWIFGALLVELIGWRWMLFIFALTAIAGSLVHSLLNIESYSTLLGASGAVMGFEGAYLGLASRWHLPDPHIWPMSRPVSPGRLALVGVFGVMIDYFSLMSGSEDHIAYGAHIGGFTMGLLIGALLVPKPRLARARR